MGTSVPSASEHATALRAAGLVQTVRRGRGVIHSLTPLGRSLLNSNANKSHYGYSVSYTKVRVMQEPR